MKIEAPETHREKYAAEAGAVIQSPGEALPSWESILEDGEELLWQGRSNPRHPPSFRRTAAVTGGVFCLMVAIGTALREDAIGAFEIGVGFFFLVLGVLLLLPSRIWRRQTPHFYSLSNRRAFRGEMGPSGKYRLVSWPITPETSFRRIDGYPPSIRFYEGRHASGRRPRYHEVFEAIPDAAEVYKLLLRIQKDAA